MLLPRNKLCGNESSRLLPCHVVTQNICDTSEADIVVLID